jgi:hypothetical protein
MFEFITSFLAKVAGRLSGIARATKSGLRAKDLHGDVWIAASEIGEERGRPIDLQDPSDQELVLTRVYNQNRRQRDWRLHYAASLDAEVEDGMRLSEQIGEVVSTDPVVVLTRRASAIEEDARLARNYTQSAAYTVALANFESDRPRFSTHLVISVGALNQRMTKADEVVRRQESLFDGFEIIEPTFMPLPGQKLVAHQEPAFESDQIELSF